VLDVTDLTHSYGKDAGRHRVLDGISLTAGKGELVSIVGPSGCGKTTLLRSIAGLLRPEGGQITLDGRPVTEVPDGLAVVFQDFSRSLLPWLSALGNVALPLRRKGLSRPARRSAALDALAGVGLGQVTHKYPGQLSGGMQQRVAIARALVCEPLLLLMDEPFGSVDAQTREDLEDLVLRSRAGRDITTLLVTHDIDESVYVGDRVVVMSCAPARVTADLPVPIAGPRDQIATRKLPEFVQLRAEVGRLVRAQQNRQPAGTGRRPATLAGTDRVAATDPRD
jgi:NitT/TauT family transport system ATP-binding protein